MIFLNKIYKFFTSPKSPALMAEGSTKANMKTIKEGPMKGGVNTTTQITKRPPPPRPVKSKQDEIYCSKCGSKLDKG